MLAFMPDAARVHACLVFMPACCACLLLQLEKRLREQQEERQRDAERRKVIRDRRKVGYMQHWVAHVCW